jgi:peptidoglycan/xylan/chitin deacetylase (PgdA/CDA1 family)
MPDSGTVVLSIDAELIWGFHDLAEIPMERVESARESWLTVVDLFETYDVPATWAVVGHLLLDACTGTHSQHPAGEDWFARDPGGSYSPSSYWFGQDLVDAVLDSKIEHEIGSHSFSHVEFGRSSTTAEIADAELRYSRETAANYGLDPTSFVFPRNNIGHRSLLAEHGFRCYRGTTPDRWYDRTPFRRAGKFVDWGIGASAPPIVSPTVDEHGLVNIPASLYLFDFEGPPRVAVETVFDNPVIRQVERGLERLQHEQEGVFHLWFHPNNMTTRQDHDRMRAIISLIAEYRDRHGIQIETMEQVSERVLDGG